MTLMTAVFWSCIAITGAVFGVMIYSIATFRRDGEPTIVARHAVMEVIWASIPLVILVLAAVPAIRMIGG
jgi:heme/copper-type cytochrome/quinol oxidase subunit 2